VNEVLVQHQTKYEQLNEDDHKMEDYRLQQNRQQDDRQNYLSVLILIDVFVRYPKTIRHNEEIFE
jgi:hypothetical protein